MTGSLVIDPPEHVAASSVTPGAVLEQVFAAQRAAFERERNPSLAVRRDRLDRLFALVSKHHAAISAAISSDFGHRSRHETELADVFVVLSALRHTRRRMRRWMRARRVATPLHLWPATSEVIRQPLGVVGVISPWNYPLQLSLLPVASALAAGNRVMLKPSELTPRFSELVHKIVAAAFATDELAVCPGDVELGRAFSRLPFDHLFFTGSTAVGRQVALAAAENLTPATLELGGKSPAIVDVDCELPEAARRIAFAKLLNAGQTCVAPDYLLMPRARVDAMVSALREAIAAMYPTLAANPDYTSIVSDRHYRRLARLVADAETHGAKAVALSTATPDVDARQFPPTLLLGVDDEMTVMREEIFGPILPVVAYDTLDEAIAYVNARPRPLALYWFGRDGARRQHVLEQTISGGTAINDACWQVAQDNLPFGGVGASGTGAYHGERGFLTFSKEKAVFRQARLNGVALFRPPYGRRFQALIALLKRFF
jgi:coniferyl-aldehyde dehydrogenase